MKKIFTLIFIFIITFTFYLVVLFLPKSYTLGYKIDNFKITETYILAKKMYEISINYNDQEYPLIFLDKYHKKRKIVQKITAVSNDDEKCLTIKINNKSNYPVCYKGDELMDFRLLSSKIQDIYSYLNKQYSNKIIKKYNNTNIYNYYNKDFYVWNYKGYDYISQNQDKTINLLNDDNYNNALVYKNQKYIITPNYDEKFYFTELLIINHNKLELFNINLDKEISYNSYYLGEINNNIYLVDKKNKNEYRININKESIKTVGSENKKGIIYTNKWEEISLNKLVNQEYIFPKPIKYDYKIVDNQLFLNVDNNLILISKNKVKDIIYIYNDEVYYLVQDILYVYSPISGEVKLLENNEWNFNHHNKIFIFD